jgi:hypothetical protein
MNQSILTEMMNGDPNTILDERMYYQFTIGLDEEIDGNGYLSKNRIADYLGIPRHLLRNHLSLQGGLRYGEALDIWQATAVIGLGYTEEQPVLNKNQLSFLKRLINKHCLVKVEGLCYKEGVAPRGRVERVADDLWFKEYRSGINAKTYTSKEILDRCAAYTFTRSEWVEFRKKVGFKLQPPKVMSRAGKNRLWTMVREMGKEWVAEIINVPIATLLSRNYRYYLYTVQDFLKIKAEWEKPENQHKLKKEENKTLVDRELVNNELIPFIEQRLTFAGKEKKAINHVLLCRESGLSYQQFRSRVYMGAKMTVEDYEKVYTAAKLLYKEAIENGGKK